MPRLPYFHGWTDFTPVVPSLYWNVYSSEERIKALCMEYAKLVKFTDTLVDTLNDSAQVIETIQQELPELVNDETAQQITALIESGQFAEMVREGIERLSQELTGRIEAVEETTATIEGKFPVSFDNLDESVQDRFEAVEQEIEGKFPVSFDNLDAGVQNRIEAVEDKFPVALENIEQSVQDAIEAPVFMNGIAPQFRTSFGYFPLVCGLETIKDSNGNLMFAVMRCVPKYLKATLYLFSENGSELHHLDINTGGTQIHFNALQYVNNSLYAFSTSGKVFRFNVDLSAHTVAYAETLTVVDDRQLVYDGANFYGFRVDNALRFAMDKYDTDRASVLETIYVDAYTKGQIQAVYYNKEHDTFMVLSLVNTIMEFKRDGSVYRTWSCPNISCDMPLNELEDLAYMDGVIYVTPSSSYETRRSITDATFMNGATSGVGDTCIEPLTVWKWDRTCYGFSESEYDWAYLTGDTNFQITYTPGNDDNEYPTRTGSKVNCKYWSDIVHLLENLTPLASAAIFVEGSNAKYFYLYNCECRLTFYTSNQGIKRLTINNCSEVLLTGTTFYDVWTAQPQSFVSDSKTFVCVNSNVTISRFINTAPTASDPMQFVGNCLVRYRANNSASDSTFNPSLGLWTQKAKLANAYLIPFFFTS